MKVFETYFGGKGAAGSYQKIINCIRPHETLIIPFLGNGSVLRNLKPCQQTFAYDIDEDVIKKWQAAPVDRNIYLGSLSFMESLKKPRAGKDTVIYMDPPYPWETRGKTRYKFDLGATSHYQLLSIAKKLNCDVLISTYPNKMYESELSTWYHIDYKSMTRGGVRTERLYMNYDPGKIEELHDYSYLGENCTDRQRIKRKIQRFKNKLSELPVLERNAILNGLDPL